MNQTQRPVKILYLHPTDRPVNPQYLFAIRSAVEDVQSWFKEQLLGKTFSIIDIVEIISLQYSASHYLIDSWQKIEREIPVGLVGNYVVVVYADVLHGCNAPGRLGAAAPNLTILPRQDMDGLIGQPVVDDCNQPVNAPISRWVGGLAHELGHTFGLPHPPGCDQGDPACDSKALMWNGYRDFPNTYLRFDEKIALLNHPSFQKWLEVKFTTRAQWLFDAYPDGRFTMSDVTPNGPVPIDYSNREGEEWLLKVVNGELRFFETKSSAVIT